jgi:hypothetical protein
MIGVNARLNSRERAVPNEEAAGLHRRLLSLPDFDFALSGSLVRETFVSTT